MKDDNVIKFKPKKPQGPIFVTIPAKELNDLITQVRELQETSQMLAEEVTYLTKLNEKILALLRRRKNESSS